MSFDATRLQQRFLTLRENKLFETFVIFVIIFSALLIGAKTYDIPAGTLAFLHALDWAVTLFFLAEILVRMVAEGSLRAFFRKGWNVFDFVIVVVGVFIGIQVANWNESVKVDREYAAALRRLDEEMAHNIAQLQTLRREVAVAMPLVTG